MGPNFEDYFGIADRRVHALALFQKTYLCNLRRGANYYEEERIVQKNCAGNTVCISFARLSFFCIREK